MLPTQNSCPPGYDSFYEAGLQCRRAAETIGPRGVLLVVLATVALVGVLVVVRALLGGSTADTADVSPDGAFPTGVPDGGYDWTAGDAAPGDGPRCDLADGGVSDGGVSDGGMAPGDMSTDCGTGDPGGP